VRISIIRRAFSSSPESRRKRRKREEGRELRFSIPLLFLFIDAYYCTVCCVLLLRYAFCFLLFYLSYPISSNQFKKQKPLL
jgi:hypothetical protein